MVSEREIGETPTFGSRSAIDREFAVSKASISFDGRLGFKAAVCCASYQGALQPEPKRLARATQLQRPSDFPPIHFRGTKRMVLLTCCDARQCVRNDTNV